MARKSNKKKQAGSAILQAETVRSRKGAPPAKRWALGWILLLGPLCIVLFLFFFGDLPWLTRQSGQGAQEAADKLLVFGRDQLREGRLQEAYGTFQEALQIKPDHAKSHALLAQLFHAAGDRENAMAHLRRAIALNPPQKDLFYNNLGILYAQKGDLDTALVLFQTALATGMKTASIYQNIGLLHMARRDYAAAALAFQEAVEHLPGMHSLYLEMLRAALTDYYDNEEKREVYESIQAALDQGVRDSDLAIYDDAILRQYVQNTPGTAQHYQNLGEALQALGRWEEAQQSFAAAARVFSASAPAHLQLGLLLMRKGDLEAAKREFELALKYNPRSSQALQALGEVSQALNTRR